MNNDSSFSFPNKRRHQFRFPASPDKKPRKTTVKEAILHIKTLGLPLISKFTGQVCESIRLEPYKPCTIGRKLQFCDFIVNDSRVSKRHCQLYFDSLKNKIYLCDGLFFNCSGCIDSFSSVRTRVSTNGAFVNGVRISGLFELNVGDVVRLVCGNEEGCGLGASLGFSVEKAVFVEKVDDRSLIQMKSCDVRSGNVNDESECCRVKDNPRVLLSWCRDILCSDDPVSCIRKCIALDKKQRIDFSFRNGLKNSSGIVLDNDFEFCLNGGIQIECRNRKRVYTREVESVETGDGKTGKEIVLSSEKNNVFNFSSVANAANGENAMQIDGGRVDTEHGVISNAICNGDIETVEIGDGKSEKEVIVFSEKNTDLKCSDIVSTNVELARGMGVGEISMGGGVIGSGNSIGLSLEKQDYSQCRKPPKDKNFGGCIMPPGNRFYLNRLQFMGQDMEEIDNVVSLPELFHPIESLQRVFIATFTSDILWFLSYCKIPPHLPVTIACHSAERCWSSDPDKRTSVPFSEFPNLTVVYPPFPDVIAFNKDRKNSGIACHHPKLIVLQRENSLRVVITSANLVAKQWHNVTNTVWWQDFPQLDVPDCLPIFTQLSGKINLGPKCDFAAQLAGFMASLIADVPSQDYWILELIKYDFKEAAGYLVASVPGIHLHRSLCAPDSKNYLVGNRDKLVSFGVKFLSSVEASVVGLSHIYRATADSNGEQLKKLALFLGKCHENMDGMSEIILRRDTKIPADRNAVSVLIPNPEEFSVEDFVQLGFLPRDVAKWVAPLSDSGLFAFSAYIYPKEVLATALEGNNNKVKLILYVYAGPSFSNISEVSEIEYISAICSLVASSRRYVGLWRLKEVLGQYKWPEHLESEFFFGSSSVGSVNAQFLAAFSAAAGKQSMPFSDSQESDPDWGCWSASQELKNPSVNIIFPSIERVKSNISGIMASRRLLCFSQKTWQRLKGVGILRDAIPYPSNRVGFPMHVKVGRRRFQSKKDGSSFGWVYSGSHNFSAAAWGRPFSDTNTNHSIRNTSVLGSRLHISNYELGILFIVPPPDALNCSFERNIQNLDDIVLPFVLPPPKYSPRDIPATAQAMREAFVEMSVREREINEALFAVVNGDCLEEEIGEDEDDEVLETDQLVTRERDDEKAYADKLWSQVDSSES